MATLGMRHAVLYVSDPQASARFYQKALGLVIKSQAADAVFLTSPASATDHDLGLFRAQGQMAPADHADPSNEPLDLNADIARWGAHRPGRGAS